MNQMTPTQNSTQQLQNLSGEWIGHYRGHFDQVIKITQLGEEVVAVKITGDDHVPGGAVTFRANVIAASARARWPRRNSATRASCRASSKS